MRISDVMQVTGVKREHFNALRRADNLPFDLAVNDKVAGWAQFDIVDAFKLRLMIELMGADLSDSQIRLLAGFASKVVSNAIGYAEDHDPQFFAASSGNPIFLGAAEFTYVAEAGTTKTRSAWFCGSMNAFAVWVQKESSGGFSDDGPPKRLVLVNATDAAIFVLKNAKALGMIEPGRATE